MAPAEGKPVRVRRYIRFRNGINETVREHGRSKRRWFRWGGKGALQGVREARIENRPPAGAGGLERDLHGLVRVVTYPGCFGLNPLRYKARGLVT